MVTTTLKNSDNVTYSNSAELFIPILNPQLVRDKSINRAWLQFELEPEHSNKTTLSRIFHLKYEREKITDNSEGFIIRHKKRFEWDVVRNVPDSANKLRLDNYIKTRRKEFQYIYSANELWYLKRNDLIPGVINHSPLVLIYSAMHRLSELARYEPDILKSHLEKDASWLLNEFINKSVVQFIDQISSEITGNQFRITGFRS